MARAEQQHMPGELSAARARMVDVQLARRQIHDVGVLRAMASVPREIFVAPGFEEFAYEDSALPIAEGQTISQPYIVALMLEEAGLNADTRLLEIGTGSGYAAAVASRIVKQVYTIERHAALTDAAKERFAALGYRNIELRTGDGTKGWPEAAPFDAILVAAGGPDVPRQLREQLAVGGKLIIPVGEAREQSLRRITRRGTDAFDEDELGAVRFVPLIGEAG